MSELEKLKHKIVRLLKLQKRNAKRACQMFDTSNSESMIMDIREINKANETYNYFRKLMEKK